MFPKPSSAARSERRRRAVRRDEILQKFDIIHGHFVADKYLGLFPKEDFVAFFRDPYQQALSHYCFLLRNPQREHLEEKMFHEAKMTLHDYLRWDAFHDHQSQYLGSVGNRRPCDGGAFRRVLQKRGSLQCEVRLPSAR